VTDGAVAPTPVRRGRSTLRAVASLALVVAVFVFVLPRVADLSEVWREVRAMTWLEDTTLVGLALWNLATYCFLWMACLPGLSFLQAGVVSQSSTAVANTVPGGSYVALGLTYSMLTSWGHRRSVVTLTLLITGIWDTAVKLVLPIAAVALLAAQGDSNVGLATTGLLGVAVLVAVAALAILGLRSEHTAARIGTGLGALASRFTRLVRRPPAVGWDIALVRFREKTVGLFRFRWRQMSAAAVASHLSLFLVLLLALRHVGVSEDEVGWVEVLAAFSLVRLVTAIPLTPGGLGVFELVLTGALVAAGSGHARAVAAVLVYRLLTFLVPIPLGIGCYFVWRRNHSWRDPAARSLVAVADDRGYHAEDEQEPDAEADEPGHLGQ
jgi:putative heme transporter